MPTIARKFSPDTIQDNGPVPQQIQRIRLCLRELYRTAGLGASSAGGGSSSGSGGTVAAPFVVQWRVNGPYRNRVGTRGVGLDGAWIVTTACTITAIYLWRGTAGSSGQTVVDVMFTRGGVTQTLYTTPANRPTLAYNDADSETHANLPDIVDLIPGDAVTINAIEADSGRPLDFTLDLEAA